MALGLKKSGFESQLDVTQYVFVSNIQTDDSLQHRVSIDDSVVSDYTAILKGGGELAPIKLIRDPDGALWLWDGHQTVAAAKAAKVEKLRAEIERGTKRDAWLKSLGANAAHGARRTRKDLNKAIRDAITDREIRYSLLAEDERHTYTSLAKLVNTSRKSIRNHWLKYVAEEVNEEIDESLAACSGMLVSQAEIVGLVVKDLHVPPWVIEQRQIEVAFNLSKPGEPELDDEPPAPAPESAPAPPPPAGSLEIKPPAAKVGVSGPSLKLGGTAPSIEIKPPTVEVGAADPAVEVKPTGPTIEVKPPTIEVFGLPREHYKHGELPIYQWDPLRRAAASPEEIEQLVTNVRMMGGSMMEINNASMLYVDAKIDKEREELPLLPDVWGGDTYYVIKLKVKK